MTNEEIDILIYRFLEEQASQEEEKALLTWVESSEENKKYFISLKKIHVHSQSNSLDFETEPALKSVLSQIDKPQTKSRKLYYSIAAIAASVVLVLGVWKTFNTNTIPSVELAAIESVNYIANDSMQEFVLADKSIVSVSKGSQIKVFDFNQKTRSLNLNGKAYFKVTPNPEKPFVISVGTVEVTVLGTSFEVNENTALNEITVSVIEGKVQVVDTLTQAIYILLANESCTISPSKAYKTSFTSKNFLAWKTGELLFDDTPLETAVADLSTLFNREFVVSSDAAKSCKLNATFTVESTIEEVKAVLAYVLKAQVDEKDSVIYLDLKSCDK